MDKCGLFSQGSAVIKTCSATQLSLNPSADWSNDISLPHSVFRLTDQLIRELQSPRAQIECNAKSLQHAMAAMLGSADSCSCTCYNLLIATLGSQLHVASTL